MSLRVPFSFRTTLLVTVVAIVAITASAIALVSYVYDRRIADKFSATMPRDEAMELLREQRQWHLLLVVLLVAVGFGLAVWLAEHLSGPMRRLTLQSQALAAGQAALPIPESGPAELRVLAEHFNRMATAIVARETELSTANAELARNEAVFRGLFEHTSDCVVLFRVADNGQVICEDVNPATVTSIGAPRERIIGKMFRDYLPDAEVDWLTERFGAAIRTGLPTAHERRLDMPAGERWFSTVVVPLPDANGKIVRVASVARDVTVQRRAEQAARSYQQRLELHRKSTPLGIIQWDADFCVLAWNPAAARMFGYAEADALGRHASFIVPEEARAHVDRVWQDLLGQRGGTRSTNRNLTRDGRLIECEWYNTPLVNESGVSIGAGSVVEDVTERRQMERALRESEAFFTGLVESALDAIVAVDERDVVLLYNGAAERMFGIPAGEIFGRPIERVIPGGLCALAEQCGFMIRRANGELFPAEASISRLQVANKSVCAAIIRDVSEHAHAEAEIRRLNVQLERRVAERTAQLAVANRELESFAYSVSHDLRAPLRSIDGFSKALLEDHAAVLNDEGRDFLTRVRSNSQRMGELIDDLLNLSRVSRGELRPTAVNLSQVAERLMADWRQHEPERHVTFDAQPDVVAIGDDNLLRVVLDNLLGNAWKYTSKTAHAHIAFGVLERDGERIYFVRDNGAGYDARYAGKLFQPFQRLHRPDEFEGHGIGLATVLRVVSRHGGRTWSESEVDRGATFYFTLATDRSA